MGFFEELARRRESEFYSHISSEVKARVEIGKEMGPEEFKKLEINSYEATLIYPTLSNAALVELVRRFLNNCGQRKLGRMEVASTYDEELLGRSIYLLCDRLESVTNTKAKV